MKGFKTMKYQLYGDGIHDDYPAIQEMIDSGVCEVSLPAPKKHYLISQSLVLPSNFRLVLPRFAEIRLAERADCVMLRNRWTDIEMDPSLPPLEGRHQIWYFAREISPAPEHRCENIEVIGGIWNFNNKQQLPNPLRTLDFGGKHYTGFGMLFFNVQNLKISNLTLKDPVNFALTLDVISYFTVEDITFDFNYGNPDALNMDGVHLDGHCHHGMIRNLKGACYDDLVAINAHEGYAGPITNIEIDGLYAEDCHSAVRLLAVQEEEKNIHISNVFGTYYQYCIGLTKFYKDETKGGFDAITIDNVYTSKAIRYEDRYAQIKSSKIYPLIWIQNDVKIKNLTLRSIHRREYNVPIETLYIGKGYPIDNLIIDDLTVEDHTGEKYPVIVNDGEVKNLVLSNIRTGNATLLTGSGTANIQA